MKKNHYVVLSLFICILFAACNSTKGSAEYLEIKEQPSAIIHILDDSSDSDYKLSKVNNRKIERVKTENGAVKVPSEKPLKLHFEKSSRASNTSTAGKASSLEKTDSTYSWTVESPKTTVTETTVVQEIIFDCPELNEAHEYTLTVFPEGFRLEEISNSVVITEGRF